MWIELHGSARTHPKINHLARDLGIPRVHAMGHVTTLWLWTLDMAPDGNLASFGDEDIEDGACWEGEPGAFVAACVVRRLLDESENGLLVHDWDEYAKFLKERERKRKWRENKTSGDITSVDGTSPDVPVDRQTDRPDRQTDQPTNRQTDRPRDDDASRHGAGEVVRVADMESLAGGRFVGPFGPARELLGLVDVPLSVWEKAVISEGKTWEYAGKLMAGEMLALADRIEADRKREEELAAKERAREAEDANRFTTGADGAAGILKSLAGRMGIT